MLLAYGKLDLFETAITGAGPDDPHFCATLEGAIFPRELDVFKREMRHHRLRREITATVLCNDIVGLCGPTFPTPADGRARPAATMPRPCWPSGSPPPRKPLRFDKSWAAVAALDGRIPAEGADDPSMPSSRPYCAPRTYWLARRAGQKGLAGPKSLENRPQADVAGFFSAFRLRP